MSLQVTVTKVAFQGSVGTQLWFKIVKQCFIVKEWIIHDERSEEWIMSHSFTENHWLTYTDVYDSNGSLASWFSSGQVKFGVTHLDGQVEVNSYTLLLYQFFGTAIRVRLRVCECAIALRDARRRRIWYFKSLHDVILTVAPGSVISRKIPARWMKSDSDLNPWK